MKNREKYAEEIKKNKISYFCSDFIKPYILKSDSCDGMTCEQCRMLQVLWLEEEYTEPGVDWSKVAVDTPILVKDSKKEEWNKRYFARYENGTIYAWKYGCTSWTAYDNSDVISWEYFELAEREESDE